MCGKWLNALEVDGQDPSGEYFVAQRLDMWLNYCDLLRDAHDTIAERVMAAYGCANNELALKRIVGEFAPSCLSCYLNTDNRICQAPLHLNRTQSDLSNDMTDVTCRQSMLVNKYIK